MSDHARISPSAFDRIKRCPGSVVLSAGMPQKTSTYAEDGTAKHAFAAELLEGRAPVIPEHMREPINFYVNYVNNAPGILTEVETKVRINDDVWGTMDVGKWNAPVQEYEVIDAKFGVMPVDPKSLQLKLYAVGAIKTFGYDAKTVKVTIVQPDAPHADGPIRSHTYTAFELLEFQEEVEEVLELVRKAEKANDITPFINPSEKACRWCLGAPICPALRKKANDAARRVFAPQLPYQPKELAEALDAIPLMEAWIKNTREFAYAEAERGHAIPSYKLVEKRATRKWRDEKAAAAGLKSAGVEPWEYKLITPAAAEKALSKEERALLDELTVKESSGHALVHESDKRPAVQSDPATAFANLKIED